MLRAFVMNWEIEGKLTPWRTTQVSVSFPEWLYGTRTCIPLTDYDIADFSFVHGHPKPARADDSRRCTSGRAFNY